MKNRTRSGLRRAGNELAAARIRAAAALAGVPVTVEIHPHAKVSPAIRPELRGDGPVSVRIGAGTVIAPGVVLRLLGGARVDIGPDCDLRNGVVLNVGGHLEMRGQNIITWYSVIHCAQHVLFEEQASCSEHTSIVDSTHYRVKGDSRHAYDNSVSAPVRLGRGSWIAGKAAVLRGGNVGDFATVASNSVVMTRIPAWALAAGQPARVLRRDWTGAPPDPSRPETAPGAAAPGLAAEATQAPSGEA